jgi:hypothetical protein
MWRARRAAHGNSSRGTLVLGELSAWHKHGIYSEAVHLDRLHSQTAINAGLAFSAIQRPFSAQFLSKGYLLELSRLRKIAKDNQELAVRGVIYWSRRRFIPPVMSKESDLIPRAMDSFRNELQAEICGEDPPKH